MGTFKSERFVSLSRNLSSKVAVETLDMPIICHSLEELVLEGAKSFEQLNFWHASVKFVEMILLMMWRVESEVH